MLPIPVAGIRYTAYGYRANAERCALAFNGERRDPFTGCYHLGNGYRAYNPALMRFQSADGLSPFSKGGINAYAYCRNDPVNFTDPSGHFLQYANPVRSILGGVLNLGITAYKYLRDMRISRRYFANDPEFAASRSGHLATGTIEQELPRLDWKQKILMGVGGSTAAGSIGTGIARFVMADSEALMTVDFALGMTATVVSGVEVGFLAGEQLGSRYPVQSHAGQIHLPSSGRHSPHQQEWGFASGPTPQPSPVFRRQSSVRISIINEQRSIRETTV